MEKAVNTTHKDAMARITRHHPVNFNKVVAWSDFGGHFAYFPVVGSLAMVSEEVAYGLDLFANDHGWRTIARHLERRFGRIGAREALGHIRALRTRGFLEATRPNTITEEQSVIDRLAAQTPRNIQILVTEACNLACSYCYEVKNGFHTGARMMSFEHVRALLDEYFEQCAGRQALNVNFFGGEPLLNFRVIREAVRYAREKAAQSSVEVGFTMTTNLTLLTEEISDFLVLQRFKVMVSLDGDREGNDRYRKEKGGLKGTHDKVVRNIKALLAKQKRAGVRPLKIRATLTAENSDGAYVKEYLRSLGTDLVVVGEAGETVAGLSEGGLDQQCVEAGVETYRGKVEHYLNSLEEGTQVSEQLRESMHEELQRLDDSLTRAQALAKKPASPTLCGVCRNMKAITPQGDIYPCHRYVGMEEYKIGNSHKGGVDHQKVRSFYEQVHEKFASKCAQCWASKLCGGNCVWKASRDDGEVQEPLESECISLRRGFQIGLAAYGTMGQEFPDELQRVVGK